MGLGRISGIFSGSNSHDRAGGIAGARRQHRHRRRPGNRGNAAYFEFLEQRTLLSLVGTYGMLESGGDFGTSYGSDTIEAKFSASGAVLLDTLTSVGSGQGGTGRMRATLSPLAGNGFSANHAEGYATSDGSIAAIAVTEEDQFQETDLNVLLKLGTGESAATLNGQYNAVLWDTPDGASFSSGLASVNFDGSGNADINITAAAQGQDSGTAFTTGESDSDYTVASDGLFTLGENQGGWVSADGSVVAWTTTVSAENTVGGVNIAILPSSGHTDADLAGGYHLMESDEENGFFSSGVATITFDGSGNYTETFTGVGDGMPGDSALPAPNTPFSGTYTVADDGQIIMDGITTGYLSADGSFAALAAVPGDTGDAQTGMSILIRDPSPAFSKLKASQAITEGTASVTLGGILSSGKTAIPNGQTVSVTIDGTSETTTTTGGNGSFTLSFPTAAIPYSATPYAITYSYAGDSTSAATSDSSTSLNVHGFPPVSPKGDTLVMFAGTDPDGVVQVPHFTSGNSVSVQYLLWDTAHKTFSYTYTPTGETTASLVAKSASGSQFPNDLSFTSASTGTDGGSGPFVLYSDTSQNWAPTSIAGASVSLTLAAGGGSYPSAGTMNMAFDALGQSYAASESTGTVSAYARNLAGVSDLASVAYGDSQLGAGRLYLAFTSATTGTFYLIDTAVPDNISNFAYGSFSLALSATHLSFGGKPLSTFAGQTLSQSGTGGSALTVHVLDSQGNLAINDTTSVMISLVSANGATLGGMTTAPVIDGVATFSDLMVDQAGTYIFSVSDPDDGLASVVSSKFTISADTSSSQLMLPVAGGPGATTVGRPLSPVLAVDVVDQFGNIITSNSSTVMLAIAADSADGSLTGPVTVNASKGVAVFKKAALSAAGTYTLTLTDASLHDTTAAPFTQVINVATTSALTPHLAASYAFGKAVSFSDTFKSGAGASVPFTGTVELLDGNGDPLGSALIAASGKVTFDLPTVSGDTVEIAAGDYQNCTLSYAGDANHAAFTTNGFTLLIRQATAKVALVPSATQLTSGQTLTLTATVSSPTVPSVDPTGDAIFLRDGTPFSTITLTGNTAVATDSPAAGVLDYSVEYTGDADFLGGSVKAKAVMDRSAPGSLAGDSLVLLTASGSGNESPPDAAVVEFPSTGAYNATALATGQQVDGPYPYTASSMTATIYVHNNDEAGVHHTLGLTFTTAATGTFRGTSTNGEGAEVGPFVLYASPIPSIAPDNLTGATVTMTATAGNGPLGSSGVLQLSLDASDGSYTLISTAGGGINTSGTFGYSLVNAAIAQIPFQDSGLGAGAVYLAFTTPNGGDYYIVSGADNWQVGTFTA